MRLFAKNMVIKRTYLIIIKRMYLLFIYAEKSCLTGAGVVDSPATCQTPTPDWLK